MELRSSDGIPVDPVPFFVVVLLAFMFIISVGPLYGQAYGLSLQHAVTVSTAVFISTSVAAYYRLVWTATPNAPRVAVAVRLQRLFYFMLAFGVILLGITVPLFL
jgi:hypothetical protein